MTNASDRTAEVLTDVLSRARAFAQAHAGAPGIDATFGYFTHHPVAPLNHARLRALLNAAAELRARAGRPLRVLDVACGGGLIASAFAACGDRVVGVDVSESELALARAFAADARTGATFLHADVLSDDWESRIAGALGGMPDAVTLAYALHHLPAVETFLARLGAWLPPGTVLLINEENPHSPVFRLKHVVRGMIQHDTETEWHRSFATWRRMLTSNGFEADRTPIGLDMLPAMGRVLPGACWSLVFSARRA